MKAGHFGTPALVVAGAALLALVLHFAVPYGYLQHEGASAAEDEAIGRDQVADWEAVGPAIGIAGTGIATTGLVIALVGGTAMLIAGFVPMPVHAARWTGFGTAVVTLVGTMMAFIAAMTWVGSGPGGMFNPGGAPVSGGFTGLIETLVGSDATAVFWVIGPAITAVLCIALFWGALRVAGGVVTTKHGFRERAQGHLKNAWWAIAFLAAVLLVPWSIVEQPDATGADQDPFFHGAHTVLVMNELTAGAGADSTWYDGMAFAIGVFLATAWVGVAFALVGAAGGVLASTGAPPALSRATHFAAIVPLLMLVWAAVMYILAWASYWKPFDGAEAQPGYVPAVVAAPLAFWVLGLLPTLRRAFGLVGKGRGAPGEAVSFD